MDNLKSQITENDTWTVAEGDYENTPFILRFRPNLIDFIDTKEYRQRHTITCKYQSDDASLMPESEDFEYMGTIENHLVAALEGELIAVLAFIYTGQNHKEWHWYVKEIEKANRKIKAVSEKFNRLQLAIQIEDEPDWKAYNAILQEVAAAGN
ncbi:MAG: DUF695 domain-containing protein [Bacteroidota bacterium]